MGEEIADFINRRIETSNFWEDFSLGYARVLIGLTIKLPSTFNKLVNRNAVSNQRVNRSICTGVVSHRIENKRLIADHTA